MQKKIMLFSLALFATSSLMASPIDWLTYQGPAVGARAAALSGSIVAEDNDPNLTFWNPAGLGNINWSMASCSYLHSMGLFFDPIFSGPKRLNYIVFAGKGMGISWRSVARYTGSELILEGSDSVNKYLKDSGVKLVNTFAKLVAEKRKYQEEIDKVEEEIEEIKEAVIKYGEKENEDVIKGSDHVLKITEKHKITSPKKGSEERLELDGILRESGKWDEVSELDVHAIDKIIIEESWDKKLLQRVKKFFTIENKKNVSLSKSQEKEK